MQDVALGISVFNRIDKLSNLLDSVDEGAFSRVIVADNGNPSPRKRALYDAFDTTDLTVLDVPFDAGLGACRERIVEELSEEYLLIVDSDVLIPDNVDELYRQMEVDPDFGGIGGILWEDARLRSNCYDLQERNDLLVRSIDGTKSIASKCGYPLVEFDVIQNVALFRSSALQDYCWDPAYKIGWEHTDFFVGHKKHTEWKFGVNPNVLFKHEPGGGSDYMDKRADTARIRRSKTHFLKKWDYAQVVNGQVTWIESNSGNLHGMDAVELGGKKLLLSLPSSVIAFAMDARDRIRLARGKPPF